MNISYELCLWSVLHFMRISSIHLGIGVMSFGFKNVDQQRIDANIKASHVQA